jgi:hypothetical protein
MPLLAWHTHRHWADRVPQPVLTVLSRESRETSQGNLLLATALLDILASFTAAGIPAVPVKGPVLAFQADGHLGLRPTGDLDVLIQESDVERARRCLATYGFVLYPEYSLSGGKIDTVKLHEIPFVQSDGLINVDLHWKLTANDLAVWEYNRLWARIGTTMLLGRPMPALSDNDLLLFLCIHGGKHAWQRLRWLVDVASLVARQPGRDWPALFRQARRQRAERLLGLGLLLAHRLLDTPLPPAVVARIARDRRSVELALQLGGDFLQGKPRPGGRFANTPLDPYQMHIRQGVQSKLLYARSLLRQALTPSPADKRVLALPDLLRPGYIAIRIARSSFRYGRILLRGTRGLNQS